MRAPATNRPAFQATPPFVVEQEAGATEWKLRTYPGPEAPREHDFVGPFINPNTGLPNVLTLQCAVPGVGHRNLSEVSSPPLTNSGVPGRAEFNGSALVLAYRAGDPPSSEKCRVQVNAHAVPTRRVVTWALGVQLGDAANPWPMRPATTAPVLLWQLKADVMGMTTFPSMGLFVDTDRDDATKLRLTWFRREQNTKSPEIREERGGLDPGQRLDVVIRAILDDRDDGIGEVVVWVNGTILGGHFGRTLIQGLAPHRWAFGLYLMSDANPVPYTYVTRWTAARMC